MFDGHQDTCHGVLSSCHEMHMNHGQEMMAECVMQGCMAAVTESGEELEMGMTAEMMCMEFMHKLDEHYNGDNDDHHMHPCNMFEDHQETCHTVIDACYMAHMHDEMAMGECIKQGCISAVDEAGEELEMGMTSEMMCMDFLQKLGEYYGHNESGSTDHHYDPHHPCHRFEEHEHGCHEIVNECQAMPECVQATCMMKVEEAISNDDVVSSVQMDLVMGMSIEHICDNLVHELHEYYYGPGTDVPHHSDKAREACGMIHHYATESNSEAVNAL